MIKADNWIIYKREDYDKVKDIVNYDTVVCLISNNEVYEVNTNNTNYSIVEDLYYGTYRVTEKTAPAHYKLNEWYYDITIDSNSPMEYDFEFPDAPLRKLSLALKGLTILLSVYPHILPLLTKAGSLGATLSFFTVTLILPFKFSFIFNVIVAVPSLIPLTVPSLVTVAILLLLLVHLILFISPLVGSIR